MTVSTNLNSVIAVHRVFRSLFVALFAVVAFSPFSSSALAQEDLPWLKDGQRGGGVRGENPVPPDDYYQDYPKPRQQRQYEPPRRSYDYEPRAPRYGDGPPPYSNGYPPPPPAGPVPRRDRRFSNNEIADAGHRFFGSVSSGLGKVIEYAFSKEGRPNGYILGEEAGGAFVAGLTYGEGILYTKDAGQHRVYWQGPSIGYDFGAEGSKTMILVYDLYSPEDIYGTFSGVSGSAYFIGGVGITFQQSRHVTLAPIRSGVGARLGANVGYLKYTRRPTWNPF